MGVWGSTLHVLTAGERERVSRTQIPSRHILRLMPTHTETPTRRHTDRVTDRQTDRRRYVADLYH